jgi:hypothetical protein
VRVNSALVPPRGRRPRHGAIGRPVDQPDDTSRTAEFWIYEAAPLPPGTYTIEPVQHAGVRQLDSWLSASRERLGVLEQLDLLDGIDPASLRRFQVAHKQVTRALLNGPAAPMGRALSRSLDDLKSSLHALQRDIVLPRSTRLQDEMDESVSDALYDPGQVVRCPACGEPMISYPLRFPGLPNGNRLVAQCFSCETRLERPAASLAWLTTEVFEGSNEFHLELRLTNEHAWDVSAALGVAVELQNRFAVSVEPTWVEREIPAGSAVRVPVTIRRPDSLPIPRHHLYVQALFDLEWFFYQRSLLLSRTR